MRCHAALAGLCASWIWVTGLAPPSANEELGYAIDGLLDWKTGPFARVAPGMPNPSTEIETDVAERSGAAAGSAWTLAVDVSVTADSNVTNGTRLDTIPIDYGDRILPVPLDPSIRQKAGLGRGISASAGARLPLSPEAAIALDAEGHALDHDGGRNDDASLLLAAGMELNPTPESRGLLQLVAFERWYGGVVATAGVGVRGRYRQQIGEGQHAGLYLDARIFESDYGADLEGSQASAYLTYEIVLGPDLTASAGLFARREWLAADRYSSLELGLYGGVTQYLSEAVTGGFSASVSRLGFDEPILFLSPDSREDWRFYASAYLAARRAIGLGLYPSLTYSYARTNSSIGFYRADRHRLKFGLRRNF